jgi:hypothetical protein
MAQKTARDPVLHRDWRQSCHCWHHRARDAAQAIKGFIVHDRESGARNAYGIGTRLRTARFRTLEGPSMIPMVLEMGVFKILQ